MRSSYTSLRLASGHASGALCRNGRPISTVGVDLQQQQQLQQEAKADASSKGPKKMRKPVVHSTSFVQNLFRGIVEPRQAFPYPEPLTPAQFQFLEDMLPHLSKTAREVNDPLLNDKLASVPDNVMQVLKENLLFGLQVPEEYGGLGLTNSAYARVAQCAGADDLGVSIILGAHQSIGFKGISLFGTPEQKAKYLPKLATGENFAAFALTEPGSGSDAASIRTRAELAPDGSHWILNGSKVWISNGGIAEIFTVFAKTPVVDEASGETVEKVSAFIVERSFGGVTNGPPEDKMGIKCSNTAEVYFDNVPVPLENILLQPGDGFKVAMQILNNGRFGMGAVLSGTMKLAIEQAVNFAVNRKQFGSTIDHFGAIQEKIAHMAMRQYATESLGFMVSGIMDSGATDYQLEAAISKVFASEGAWFVVDEAIQIMGGMGYMRSAGLEKKMRDLRIFRIFEGTNDILRLFLALTGIQYAGGHLRELQRAVAAPIANFGVVLDTVARRGKSAIGIGSGNLLADYVHPNLVDSAALVSRDIELFGNSVEKLLIKHGKHIIHEQFLLNRLAEAAIDIYVSTCVLSRCTKSLKSNENSARHEEMMTKVICQAASERVARNLGALKNPAQLATFKAMAEISKDICSHGSTLQNHPLGI